ncbi:uncharacterized protein [Procambarus clarkii]|uniref:uncharacterized protein n=1 Tax=Procambarus clarkii TaxID=6728 RepID=UPI003743F335
MDLLKYGEPADAWLESQYDGSINAQEENKRNSDLLGNMSAPEKCGCTNFQDPIPPKDGQKCANRPSCSVCFSPMYPGLLEASHFNPHNDGEDFLDLQPSNPEVSECNLEVSECNPEVNGCIPEVCECNQEVCECNQEVAYDLPPPAAAYDLPPPAAAYDLPPPAADYDLPFPEAAYDH